MKRNIFKFKIVYYISIVVSTLLFLGFLMGIISVFEDFNFIKLLIIIFGIVINLIATIFLFEKYKNTILWLNISSVSIIAFLLFRIFFVLYPETLLKKWFLFFIVYIIIINLFRNKNLKDEIKSASEIEDIGKPE